MWDSSGEVRSREQWDFLWKFLLCARMPVYMSRVIKSDVHRSIVSREEDRLINIPARPTSEQF